MNFPAFITSHEVPIGLGFSFGVFALMAVWELDAPRRPLQTSKRLRRSSNVRLVLPNTGLLRWVFSAGTVGIRSFREERWCSWLRGMRAIPFAGKAPEDAIHRRSWTSRGEA